MPVTSPALLIRRTPWLRAHPVQTDCSFLRRTTRWKLIPQDRKNYLFRIATNLIRDRFRRPRIDNAQLPEHGEGDIPASGDLAQQTQQRSDLQRAMAQLSRREGR